MYRIYSPSHPYNLLVVVSMAHTPEQFDNMMKLMQAQMDRLDRLESENHTLRHQVQAGNANIVKKPDRPTVEADSSDMDWALFLDAWKRYKKMTNITSQEVISMELRTCCSADVNKLLFEFVGAQTLDTASEEELLAHIKSVAVKGIHKGVHRLKFAGLRQQDSESITHFVARLKSQADLCEFVVPCHRPGCGSTDNPTTVSYSEDMVVHQLLVGLRNQDFQSRVLGELDTLKTLKATISRLQSLESTEECAKLMQPGEAASKSAASRYRTERRKEQKVAAQEACKGCGRTSHGNGKSMVRRDCPAFERQCRNCGTTGHFEAVCRSPKGEGKKSKANRVAEELDGEGEDATALASATFF